MKGNDLKKVLGFIMASCALWYTGYIEYELARERAENRLLKAENEVWVTVIDVYNNTIERQHHRIEELTRNDTTSGNNEELVTMNEES